jgi:hypothetical protein
MNRNRNAEDVDFGTELDGRDKEEENKMVILSLSLIN